MTTIDIAAVHAWGRDLEARRATVLHEKNVVVGRVARYYDGEADRYRELRAPVLELEEGHAMVAAHPGMFRELSEAEAGFYRHFLAVVGSVCGGSSVLAIRSGISEGDHRELVVAALRAQLASLRTDPG